MLRIIENYELFVKFVFFKESKILRILSVRMLRFADTFHKTLLNAASSFHLELSTRTVSVLGYVDH